MKLFDSVLKVINVFWHNYDTTAKKIAETLREQTDWSKTTTYTVIKKCVDKKAIRREEPNFVCHALVTKEQVQEEETTELINKMYQGMPDQLVAAILGRNKLSAKELQNLKNLIKKLS